MSWTLAQLESYFDADSGRGESIEPTYVWLMGATEPERVACFEPLRRHRRNTLYERALVLALVGTAPSAQLAVAGLHLGRYAHRNRVASVLAQRAVPWLAEFARLWVAVNPEDARETVDCLADLGLVERPSSVEYTFAAIEAYGQSAERIRRHLLSKSENGEHSIHLILSSGPAIVRLYFADDYYRSADPAATWRRQIARAVDEGVFDRRAMIKVSLNALDRATGREETVWLLRFQEELKPATKDFAKHSELLLRFLRSERSRVIGLGQRGLLQLAKAQAVEPMSLIEASSAALYRPEKIVVLTQLRILRQLARNNPELTEEILAQVRGAVEHERMDVQSAALTLIADLGTRSGVLDIPADIVSPALRGRAVAAGLVDPPPPTIEPVDLTAISQRIGRLTAVQRTASSIERALGLAARGRVPDIGPLPSVMGPPAPPPITDPAALVELFGELIEREGSSVDVHRALAGAVRTAGLPLDRRSRMMSPLIARARSRAMDAAYQRGGYPSWSHVGALAVSWATGQQLPYGSYGWSAPTSYGLITSMTAVEPELVPGILVVQTAEATRLIAGGRSTCLLADPTHRTGAVSADALLERLRTAENPSDIDTELAALRLPRGLGEDFWASARAVNRSVTGRLWVRYAEQSSPVLTLMAGVPKPDSYTSWNGRKPRPMVVAQSVVAHSVVGQSVVGQSSSAVGRPGVWRALTGLSDLDTRYSTDPQALRITEQGGAVAMWPSYAPWDHELISAQLVMPLSRGIYPGVTAAPEAIAVLGTPSGAFGPVAHLALVLALQGHAAETRTAAADLWIETASDGRLQPDLVAAAVAALARGGLVLLNRILDSIRPTVHLPIVGYRSLQALCAALQILVETKAAQVNRLVELISELTLRFGADVVPMQVIESISAARSSSALRIAARRLAGQVSTGPERPLAAAAALDGLLRRISADDAQLAWPMTSAR